MPPLEVGAGPGTRSPPGSSAAPLTPAKPAGRGAAAPAEPLAEPLAAPLPGQAARLSGPLDPHGSIWLEAAFHRDPWQRAPETGELQEGPIIVSKARWLAERAALSARLAPIGLHLESGMAIDEFADGLARFSLIALNFPKFSDGRPFSTARLLREKWGYAGELRAVGNVLSDQIPFMHRVGFDAFEVLHAPTRRQLSEGRIAEVRLYYQPVREAPPSPGARPWLRRSPG